MNKAHIWAQQRCILSNEIPSNAYPTAMSALSWWMKWVVLHLQTWEKKHLYIPNENYLSPPLHVKPEKQKQKQKKDPSNSPVAWEISHLAWRIFFRSHGLNHHPTFHLLLIYPHWWQGSSPICRRIVPMRYSPYTPSSPCAISAPAWERHHLLWVQLIQIVI